MISRRPTGRVPGESKARGGKALREKKPDARPVYERLYDRGEEYRKAHAYRKEVLCGISNEFDDNHFEAQ